MQTSIDTCLAPKEVAYLIGTSERTAQRLMATNAIESFRVGPGEKLLRTTRSRVQTYQAGAFERYRRDYSRAA
jgi:hypothetical protein